MKEKYKVRCKHFKIIDKRNKSSYYLSCSSTSICLNKIGPIGYCGEFEVDWITFLLYNNILFTEIED